MTSPTFRLPGLTSLGQPPEEVLVECGNGLCRRVNRVRVLAAAGAIVALIGCIRPWWTAGSPESSLEHGFAVPPRGPSRAQLERLTVIRSEVHAMVSRGREDRGTVRWSVAVEALFDAGSYRLATDGGLASRRAGWDGLIDDLLPELIRLSDERHRLRRCGNESCRYLFLDRSRNVSRVWCEMAVCGNRVKVRRHRGRSGTASSPTAAAGSI